MDTVISELNCRFHHKRGMPFAAVFEQMLVDVAQDGYSSDTIPKELQMYNDYVDEQHTIIQLKMLPDLVRAYNEEN